MAAGSETWHPGKSFKYLPKAVCCAGTMATGAASSASAAAGSAATLTKALGGRAVETSSKATAKSRKKAKELLMDGLVRPVAMPFQLVGSGARVASLEALAATPNPEPWPRHVALTFGRDS